MRGQGPVMALVAVLLCLCPAEGARRLLQEEKVCRYACIRGLVCINGFCQDPANPAVVSLSTPSAANRTAAGQELPLQQQPASVPLETHTDVSPEELTAQEAASMSFMDTSDAAPAPAPAPAAHHAGVVSVVVVNVPVRKVPAAAATAATEVGGK